MFKTLKKLRRKIARRNIHAKKMVLLTKELAALEKEKELLKEELRIKNTL